jgi:hypothetical protein
MGRFYKTAKPDFLDDIIYQPPWELMQDVIKVHDGKITKANETVDAYDTLMGEVNNIQDDDPVINERIDGYRTRMDELSGKMQGDLPNYRKYIPEINTLKKELERDLDNGVLGRGNEAYNDKEAENTRLDGLKADPKKTAAIKKFNDLRYTERGGLAFENKDKYNKYQDTQINPEEVFDEGKFVNDLQSHFAANQSAFATSGPGGGYIWNKNGTTKFLDAAKINTYMKNTPAMDKWRSTTKQDIMLEAYNNGVRGELLDVFVDAELKTREDRFLKATVAQLEFTQSTAGASTSVDGKDAADTRRLNELEDRDGILVDSTVETDRRTTDDKAISKKAINEVMAKMNISTEKKAIEIMAEVSKNGNLSKFIRDNNLDCNASEFLEAVKLGDKIGDRVNLVDMPRKNMSNAAKLEYRKETGAVINNLKNLDLAETRSIEITSNTEDGSKLTEDSVIAMFNKGMINVENLGGKVSTTKSKKISPPEEDAKTGEKVWISSKGKPVTSYNGDYPKTEAEAIDFARQTGVELNSVEDIQYQEVLGNKIAVTEARMYRYKSANGRVDDYEIEVTTSRKVGNNTIVEKAIVKIPAGKIKVKAN